MAEIREPTPVENAMVQDYLRLLNDADRAFMDQLKRNGRDDADITPVMLSAQLFHIGSVLGMMETMQPIVRRSKLQTMIMRGIDKGRTYGRQQTAKALARVTGAGNA